MIISVHIPKAAGTSVLEHWIKIYGPDAVCVDYNGMPVRYSEINIKIGKKFKRYLKKILSSNPVTKHFLTYFQRKRVENLQVDVLNDPSIKVIHGHFSLDKYSQIFPEADVVTVLRDPWERIISHYLYWKEHYYEIREHIPEWFTLETTFTNFVENPEMRNLQSEYLCGKDLESFTLVGSKEDFSSFITELYLRYSPERLPEISIKENVGVERLFLQPGEDLDKIRTIFLDLNNRDIELYQSFVFRNPEFTVGLKRDVANRI